MPQQPNPKMDTWKWTSLNIRDGVALETETFAIINGAQKLYQLLAEAVSRKQEERPTPKETDWKF